MSDALITVNVKLFAVVRERAGVSEMTLHLATTSTVAAARDAVTSAFPHLEGLLRSAACAVNRSYASLDSTLNDGDELAIIPPVSGG